VDFARDVQPVFARACIPCHGAQKQQSSFRLDDQAAALKGGDLGADILPGRSGDSPLIHYVAGLRPDLRMPPRGPRLAPEEIGLLRAWIDQGARWPDAPDRGSPASRATWWSLRPLVRPVVPSPKADATWLYNPVDAFILTRLQAKGLRLCGPADRRTLIRRLFFDLIGLPPSPGEIEAFVSDTDPLAYEKLVDRLLASPQYGERWARHWLDVVHYGETHGYDKDKPRPNAWPYRDYVIRALNDDRPYRRFVQEQVAGDVLFPESRDGIEALGFLAAGPWDFIGHAEVPESKIDGRVARHLDRDDMVSNTISTFTSLTVHCAQCHDHKFDPISQEDYYCLQAVFAALDRADRTYDIKPAVAQRRAVLLAQQRAWLSLALAGVLALDWQQAPWGQWAVSVSRLTAIQRDLGQLPAPHLVYAGTIYHGTGPFRGTGPDGGRPRVIRLLRRGDVTQPGKEVGPGALSAVHDLPARFTVPPNAPEGARRAALAAWLTDPHNPLPWRSLVNRVWLYHFGRGIADSPNDLGRMGRLPTHPELLDWLAVEFRDSGQSLKRLHRLLVTSATYRQSSAENPQARAVDGENTLYWRANRRRLEAEAVRDSVLQVAGQLDVRMFGPSFQDFKIDKPEHSPHYEYEQYDVEDPRCHRRSVYRFLVRSRPQPFMGALDCADPSMLVDKRNETVTPLQALALLNDQLTVVLAGHFAARVSQEGSKPADRIRTAFQLALGRPPGPDEQRALEDYAGTFGLANTCRVILNLNEFVFVD
jgi:hypothetical protein